MSAGQLETSAQVYQFKVVLREGSPLIWRRLLVTSATTIAQLHAIFQAALGWGGSAFTSVPYARQGIWHLPQ
jgi:hypothetical protein